jgi:flagellar biosynthesis protein FliR
MNLADLGSFSSYILVFCRVGCCLMLTPGYSSPHLPMQARLFLAIAISVSITPLLAGSVEPAGASGSGAGDAVLIAAECLTGAAVGTLARCFFAALQFAAAFITQLAGYSGLAAADDGSGEAIPELGALLATTVVALVFILDVHVDVIKSLIDSYTVLPVGALHDPGDLLDRLVVVAVEALHLSVRISMPFVATAVLINVAFGFVNKVAPQVPVFFISAPFLALAALWLLYVMGADLATTFTRDFIGRISRA